MTRPWIILVAAVFAASTAAIYIGGPWTWSLAGAFVIIVGFVVQAYAKRKA